MKESFALYLSIALALMKKCPPNLSLKDFVVRLRDCFNGDGKDCEHQLNSTVPVESHTAISSLAIQDEPKVCLKRKANKSSRLKCKPGKTINLSVETNKKIVEYPKKLPATSSVTPICTRPHKTEASIDLSSTAHSEQGELHTQFPNTLLSYISGQALLFSVNIIIQQTALNGNARPKFLFAHLNLVARGLESLILEILDTQEVGFDECKARNVFLDTWNTFLRGIECLTNSTNALKELSHEFPVKNIIFTCLESFESVLVSCINHKGIPRDMNQNIDESMIKSRNNLARYLHRATIPLVPYYLLRCIDTLTENLEPHRLLFQGFTNMILRQTGKWVHQFTFELPMIQDVSKFMLASPSKGSEMLSTSEPSGSSVGQTCSSQSTLPSLNMLASKLPSPIQLGNLTHEVQLKNLSYKLCIPSPAWLKGLLELLGVIVQLSPLYLTTTVEGENGMTQYHLNESKENITGAPVPQRRSKRSICMVNECSKENISLKSKTRSVKRLKTKNAKPVTYKDSCTATGLGKMELKVLPCELRNQLQKTLVNYIFEPEVCFPWNECLAFDAQTKRETGDTDTLQMQMRINRNVSIEGSEYEGIIGTFSRYIQSWFVSEVWNKLGWNILEAEDCWES